MSDPLAKHQITAPIVFDNDAERAASVPISEGRLAVQLDTGLLYRSSGTTAGAWILAADFSGEVTVDAVQTMTNKTLTAPTINGGTHTAITALGIRSTGAAFDLTIASTEVFTAGRMLTIKVNDGARTLDLAGNVTHAGAFARTFTATATTSLTLPTTGTLATLAGTEGFSNKTLTAPVLAGAGASGVMYTAAGVMTASTNLTYDGTTFSVKGTSYPTLKVTDTSTGKGFEMTADGTAAYLQTTSNTHPLFIQPQVVTFQSTSLGFFSATAVTKPAVTGSKTTGAAYASLLTALATLGLITDSSSA